MMRSRLLRTGHALTELGLGVAQLGNLSRIVSDEDAESAVEAAWDAGIRYFDTAPHYGLGLSERRLGALVADRPREEFVVSTKVGRLLEPDPDGAGRLDDEGFAVPATMRRVWDFTADGVRRSLDASLERLGLDRVDIVYIHDPDDHWKQASAQAVPALVELREQGVIGAIGVGMNQHEMLTEFIRRSDIDLVMCAGRYTLLEQPAADEMLPLAQDRGVGVVIAGVYNSGLLATSRPRAQATYDYAPADSVLVARVHAIADICEANGVALPDAAVAFPVLHPAVVSVVVGCRDGEQVDAAVSRYEAEIPTRLWTDLAEAGLLRPDLIPSSRELT